MDTACDMYGRNVYRILVRKPKEKKPHGRRSHKNWDIIKTVLKKDGQARTKLN